jgi:hypothetical protein
VNTQVATSYKGTVPGTEVGQVFYLLSWYLFDLDFYYAIHYDISREKNVKDSMHLHSLFFASCFLDLQFIFLYLFYFLSIFYCQLMNGWRRISLYELVKISTYLATSEVSSRCLRYSRKTTKGIIAVRRWGCVGSTDCRCLKWGSTGRMSQV